MKKYFSAAVITTAIFVPVASFAAEGDLDLSSLTDSFSVAPVITGVLAIAATLMGLYAAIRGAGIIMGLVRGKTAA